MQNRSDKPQWPWNTRPVTHSVLIQAWCPTTLQHHTILTPDHWSNLARPHYHVHGHSLNHLLNPRPSLIQSVTVSHSSSHSLQMDTHSDDYLGITFITPSICGGWTYEDSSSSYGWMDDQWMDSPQPYNRNGPLWLGLLGQYGLCSTQVFFIWYPLPQKGQMNPSCTWVAASAPCLALWCWHIPWVLAYSRPQSGHATQLPHTQALVCSIHICLVASTFPHLLHGNFSPRWTPMCTIKWWWVLKDFSNTRQSFLSLVTAGIWYRISVTSLAWAPSGKSSPWRRANTCCSTHFKALFFTTNSSSTRWGSSGGTVTGAGPPNLCLATPGPAGRPSASSSLDSPTTPSSSVSLWWSTFHLDTFSV